MTEEQLNKEAEEYLNRFYGCERPAFNDARHIRGDAFKDGYRSRDKKFKEMEAVLKEVADHLEDSRWSPEEDLYAKIIKVLG